jgi:hypothetical protein
MTAQPPRGARADQAPHGASHRYYNVITYNKHIIIYTTTIIFLVFILLIINKIIIFIP